METKFRSVSYETKTPFPISLPPRMLPWYKHTQRRLSEKTVLIPSPGALEQRKESYRSRFHSLPCILLCLHFFISQIVREPLSCARHWASTWGYQWVKRIWCSLFFLSAQCHLSEEVSLTDHPSQQSGLHPCHTLSPYLFHFSPFSHIQIYLFSFPISTIM